MRTKRVKIQYVDDTTQEVELKEWTAKQQLDFLKRIKAQMKGQGLSVEAPMDIVITAMLDVSGLNIDLNKLTSTSLFELIQVISELNNLETSFRQES